MNYRHAYHAGNFADVVKHIALTQILLHLRKKDTAFHVLDCHAGIGRYDLLSTEAGKTGEASEGIVRLLAGGDLPPSLDAYLDALRSVNPDWPHLRFYPGSPVISRCLLRAQDRLTLVELHPEDAACLRRECGRDRRIKILEDDAYIALKALLPPPERRGLALIDPPFEEKDEFQKVARGLNEALRRWQTGIFGVWYPIKAIEAAERFLGEVATLGQPCFTAQFLLRPPVDPERLNGCGLLVVNPPWKLDETLREALPFLATRLGATGEVGVRWLVEAK